MSWGMYVDIYVRNNKNEWTCKAANMSADFLKNLCDIRGQLSDKIVQYYLSKNESFEKAFHSNDGMEKKYLFSIPRDKAPYVPLDKVLTVSKERAEELKKYKISDTDFKSLTTDGVGVYVNEKCDHSLKYGSFYNVHSFAEYRDNLQKEYDDLIIKRKNFKDLKKSLNYLKLNEDEKENVNSEYSYIDDDIDEILYKLHSAIGMVVLLNFYEQYDDEAVAYIYSE